MYHLIITFLVIYQAGLPVKRTYLVDESEAASTYLRNQPFTQIKMLNANLNMKKKGYTYLLIDIGGNLTIFKCQAALESSSGKSSSNNNTKKVQSV